MEETKQYIIGKVKCRAEVCGRAPVFQGYIQQEAGYWYLRTKFYGTREEAETALQQLLDDLGAKPVERKWHWELNDIPVYAEAGNFMRSGDENALFAVSVRIAAQELLEKYATKVYDDEEVK